MNSEDPTDRTARPGAHVQAHILRAAKMPAGRKARADGRSHETRNWSLFFFFRIMQQAEMSETATRLAAAAKERKSDDAKGLKGRFVTDRTESPAWKAKMDLAFPASLNAGLVRQARTDDRDEKARPAAAAITAAAASDPAPAEGRPSEPAAGNARPGPSADKPAPDAPAPAFLNWLRVLLGEPGAEMIDAARHLRRSLPADESDERDAVVDWSLARGRDMINDIATGLAPRFEAGRLEGLLGLARSLEDIVEAIRAQYPEILSAVRESIDAASDDTPHGPLARMILYELLRQGGPMFTDPGFQGVLRGEAEEGERLDAALDSVDRTPITMAFTFAGLQALKLHPYTLASFPEAFREGMAARARRLGDVGASAPENWEGEFGLDSIHGYFTGGSNLERMGSYSETFWKNLRREIRLFNEPAVEEGSELRAWIGLMFRLVGLEIVHIELGQDPYEVDRSRNPDGEVRRLPHRMEHFGFRDGVSQPFVDMGLGDTLPGGGTADRRGTWSPVAPGEIFLDREDESGQEHLLPLNRDLRRGSTYLVFRKLEQDVEGFRAFLEQQRPEAPAAQRKLAAQFFGRWPNGTSLVHSPYTERSTAGAETEAGLNDFRYAADDPLGRKCPLGAHVRRSNPRDIGGRDDVRHHRILRRGIAYGGPLLGEGEPNDGEKRGILFIAANSRIDLQFEVVQGDWLNRGEFLGQAGLDRCPIAGSNDGSLSSRFLEAGAVAPVTGLPAFVTLRGGDYFFAPGIGALRMIAHEEKFAVPMHELPYRGHTMADVTTPTLFSDDRLREYWSTELGRGRPVRVNASAARAPKTENVAYVGWYHQVKRVLSNDMKDEKSVYFSVEPYCTAGRRITRGDEFLIGTDAGSPSRDRIFGTLKEAWRQLGKKWAVPGVPDPRVSVQSAAKARLDAALRRTAGARRIDLVEDLASQAAYGVLDKVYGIRGPKWLTELAGAIPFSRQHVGDLPPDWLAALKGERPKDPGLKTMQVWTTFLVADLIGNHQSQLTLQAVARQAGSEMLNHIDQVLYETFAQGEVKQPRNLVEAFVYIGQQMQNLASGQIPEYAEGDAEHLKILLGRYAQFGENAPRVYQKDVAIILLEILGSTLAVIPLTFGSVMAKLLDLRIDLSLLLPRLKDRNDNGDMDDSGAAHIIYEAERLNPNSAIRVRRCLHAVEDDDKLAKIKSGDFVAAVIAKANMDRKIFWKPERFSLGESDPQADTLKQHVDEAAGERHPRDVRNYLLFGVKDSNKHCWGSEPVAMPVLKECIYAAGRLQGLRKVAGPLGVPQKIGSVTIGYSARFTRTLSKDARE